ncbi:hypothetical protein PENSPDRAFT_695399 [Peniophora sp. CONT]|nr:hypothetical protein PENSPDRAFT_695399 [Peniophora sp. CONT]
MPYVAPANYPTDIPKGGVHLDVDDADDFRLPVGLDTNIFLYQILRMDGSIHWVIRENARTSPHVPTAAQLVAAASFAKDRLICTLRMQLATATQGPTAAPVAHRPLLTLPLVSKQSGCHSHSRSQEYLPRSKEGMYELAPRDFTFSVALYMQHQQYKMNKNFADDRKICIFAGFLEQAAGRWYNQLVVERNRQAQGPLRSMDALADKCLNNYKDVNMHGCGQDTLINWFKMGVKVALKDKVSNQGKNRPTTLEGWYEDAMYFDRQYREDQLEKSMSRGGNSANNNSSGSRANVQQQQQR